jgi:retron-type reverse transcriptase
MRDFFTSIAKRFKQPDDREKLARWAGYSLDAIQGADVSYTECNIPKRTGGFRTLAIPNPTLKQIQGAILRRLLRKLPAHPAAMGFERERSIVTHARRHVGQAVVVNLDIRDFFTSTADSRVRRYFRGLRWSDQSAELLTRLVTWRGGLPQGAPTSPRLSNLVNYQMDARLAAAASRYGAIYSRYADDLTFSFSEDHAENRHFLMWVVKQVLADDGYLLHHRKKRSIRRRNARQVVTGLVVNERVRLPREVRRRLRAAEHHLSVGRMCSMTADQLAGWRAFEHMIESQGAPLIDDEGQLPTNLA